MNRSAAEILEDVRRLPPGEFDWLIGELLQTGDGSSEAESEASWKSEVERRGAIGGFGGVGRGGEPARELFDGRHGFFERFVLLRVGSERDTRLWNRAARIRASIGRRKRCVTDRRAWRARERASGGLSPQYPGEYFFAS